MADKISQAELKQLEKQSGTTVRRKMGAQPASEAPPVQETPEMSTESVQPEPEVNRQHASMAASMAAHESEMRRIQNETTAKLAEFSQQLVLIAANSDAKEYTFDMVRDDRELLKRVYARPGIHND